MGWKNEDLLQPRKFQGDKKYIEINGEIHTLDEWCSIIGIHKTTFYRRIKKGLSGEELKSKAIK